MTTPEPNPHHAQAASDAMESVLSERQRQDAKWGVQNHDPFFYLAILAEEFGETAKEALELRAARSIGEIHAASHKLRTEAIQTAAVALAIVECLERAEWKWGQ